MSASTTATSVVQTSMFAFLSKPLPYTSDPLRLLANDLWLFFTCSLPTLENYIGIISTVWPLPGLWASPLEEMSIRSVGNVWSCAVHTVLFVAQVIFIVGVPLSAITGLPFPPLLCTPILLGFSIAFVLVNKLICRFLLNGPDSTVFFNAGPNGEFSVDAKDIKKQLVPRHHPDERWVFINGVSIGSHWLKTNLERLATTFQRPVLGIHNTTYGIPFDVIECIIQRTFCYATDDVRTAYAELVQILADKTVKKVVLIGHSQGAIEVGMVCDWLYATISSEELQKLEVYTFGNATNHWNCPMLADGTPAIKHIEHYANRWEWVARFGVLHFRPLAVAAHKAACLAKQTVSTLENMAMTQSPISTTTANGTTSTPTTIPPLRMSVLTKTVSSVNRQDTAELEARLSTPHRFNGRLFLRHAPGHLLNSHYLNTMFPMSTRKSGQLNKVIVNDVDGFFNQEIDRQAFEEDDSIRPVVAGHGGVGEKIGERSRLWKYVNGGVPGA